MPKATLMFKLPEEAMEFKAATQAVDMQQALWALKEYLREEAKYCDHKPEIMAVYDAVRNRLFDELSDRNIVLE